MLFINCQDTLPLQNIPVSYELELTDNLKGKSVLFIGDSQTSAYGWGWQDILSKNVGFKMKNTAVLGKTTRWMTNVLEQELKQKKYDFVFIFGGVNDIWGGDLPVPTFNRVQKMVNMANDNGALVVVLTGSDKRSAVNPQKWWKDDYISIYEGYQYLLLNHLEDALVIDTRVVGMDRKKDCGDLYCHYTLHAHRKLANIVENTLRMY
jgi:hypothetical protein